MKRIGMMIGIKPEKIDEYKKLHDKVWPEVLENLTELNCKNYSIYLHNNLLFNLHLKEQVHLIYTYGAEHGFNINLNQMYISGVIFDSNLNPRNGDCMAMIWSVLFAPANEQV